MLFVEEVSKRFANLENVAYVQRSQKLSEVKTVRNPQEIRTGKDRN